MKPEMCGPVVRRHNSLSKTSAEIVSEARHSLRVQSTKRPITPRDGQRQLFGKSTVHASCDNRPPSSFSLHAQNFDAPESRPGSGTRLSPLDHKPKFAIPCNAEDSFKAFPKPPTDPLEAKSRLAGARARLLRVGSLTTLLPLEGPTDGMETKTYRYVVSTNQAHTEQQVKGWLSTPLFDLQGLTFSLFDPSPLLSDRRDSTTMSRRFIGTWGLQ
uniref:Uncharacterized protein n=1 Tax=Mola mola TaxID=94237 RepID=A0A3Q4BJ18_MOLML